jgi:hypothetical protein
LRLERFYPVENPQSQKTPDPFEPTHIGAWHLLLFWRYGHLRPVLHLPEGFL